MAFRLEFLLPFAALLAMAASCHAGERITVHLESGRAFTALVADRTDNERLWLRFGEGGVSVLRPIDWRRVTGGVWRGRPLSPDETREVALSLRPAAPVPSSDAPEEEFVRFTPGPAIGAAAELPVCSLWIDARLANWDADPAPDGLVVRMVPLDALGRPVAVAATAELELIAARLRRLDERPGSHGEAVESIARGTAALTPASFGPHGALARLPFQAIDPAFDRKTAPLGLVRVRLAAPGHGVFETAQDNIPLRPLEFTREELDRVSGERHLPQEMTGRGAGNFFP